MLTRNMWRAAELVNGATGTVVDIIYDDAAAISDLPMAVIVKFENYKGPSIRKI